MKQTEVHAGGSVLWFDGTIDEFRKLQPDHAGALRWEAQGSRVLIDTNVAPITALIEREIGPSCLCTNMGGRSTAACPVHGPGVVAA